MSPHPTLRRPVDAANEIAAVAAGGHADEADAIVERLARIEGHAGLADVAVVYGAALALSGRPASVVLAWQDDGTPDDVAHTAAAVVTAARNGDIAGVRLLWRHLDADVAVGTVQELLRRIDAGAGSFGRRPAS